VIKKLGIYDATKVNHTYTFYMIHVAIYIHHGARMKCEDKYRNLYSKPVYTYVYKALNKISNWKMPNNKYPSLNDTVFILTNQRRTLLYKKRRKDIWAIQMKRTIGNCMAQCLVSH